MPVYYGVGNALVTEEELAEKIALGQVEKFKEALEKTPSTASLEFTTGQLTSASILDSITTTAGEVVPFEGIGPGKPLAIELRHVYTGDKPKGSVFDRTKDILVTSAMKSLATYNAAPRAVNFMQKSVRSKHRISNAAATEEGTPLVHYTPALTERNTVLTIEFGFDEFPNEIFDTVGGAFTQAAGIPLFVSASTYLLAAGAITKLIGTIGSRVFDRKPVFKATEALEFERAGASIPQADFRVITEEAVSPAMLQNLQPSANGLVDQDGKPYEGDIPYVIISLDGREYDEYKEFTPTAASAAVLDKFYAIREGQEQGLSPLIDALKLFNDWKFRRQADDVAAELEGLDKESEEYAKKKKEYDSLVKNILDDLLKPSE